MPNFCETTIGWGFVVPADLMRSQYLLKSWRDEEFVVQIDGKALEDREPTRDELFLTADSWILTDFTLRLPSHEQGKTALIGITNLYTVLPTRAGETRSVRDRLPTPEARGGTCARVGS